MRRTPLYEEHIKLGGKMIDFGGWDLPIQYTDILEEHDIVRTEAGLFDVSHMGEISVKGADAAKLIQNLITNDISNLKDNQIMYSPMCYSNGGVVDDLLVYKFNSGNYLLVVNSSNTDKDFEWIKSNLEGHAEIRNISDNFAQLALQGPNSEKILQKLTKSPLSDIRFFHFKSEVELGKTKALISRTGYTGEDGFEIYVSPCDACNLWRSLIETGKEYGLMPIGLGARDTLRFESALPLYGQEISKDITPLEAGLERFVKLEKENFIGKDALMMQKINGLARKSIGIEMIDRGIPRSHCEIQANSEYIGIVTTGNYSPSLKKYLGLAIVNSSYIAEGTKFNVIIRGKALAAKTAKLPFYIKKYKR